MGDEMFQGEIQMIHDQLLVCLMVHLKFQNTIILQAHRCSLDSFTLCWNLVPALINFWLNFVV